jgi:uncharacterized membrane protein YgaE (UPF0421/DUF939 family)
MQQANRPASLSLWDTVHAMDMAIACLVSYWIATYGLAPFVDRANDLLGGMWAVIATIFVFRDTRSESLSSGIARLIATCVSFALCQVYLSMLPFTPLGMVAVLAIGTLIMRLLGRHDDIITTGITTTVVMVVAGIDPQHALQQPSLRLVDTVVGIAIGVSCKCAGSYLLNRFAARPA